MEHCRAILLNVPIDLLNRLTEAATAMEISRSELIRHVLKRDVEFVLRQEVPSQLLAKERTIVEYGRWLKYNSAN